MGYPTKAAFDEAKVKLVKAGFRFSYSVMYSENDHFFGSIYTNDVDTFWLSMRTLSSVDSFLSQRSITKEVPS